MLFEVRNAGAHVLGQLGVHAAPSVKEITKYLKHPERRQLPQAPRHVDALQGGRNSISGGRYQTL